MTNEIDWYLEFVRDELMRLKDAKFTGNNEFKVNMKDGVIGNMNCSLHKSVKKDDD